MEEYLEKLLSQLRCRKARPFVEREIRSHMEDQIADNMAAGMDRKRAEEEAVRDMGDPVEAGISLDRIHRPRLAWGLLLLAAAAGVLGAVIHWRIGLAGSGPGYLKNVLAGIALMCFFYYIDYTAVARFARGIGAGILGFVLAAELFGPEVSGITYYVGNVRMWIFAALMFYIPIYGGILYKYYRTGYLGLARSLVWLLLPVLLAWRLPGPMLAGILLVSMLVQLTIAVARGWFQVPVKRTLACLWTAGTALPALSLALLYGFRLLAEYQRDRIRAFFVGSEDADYITNRLRALARAGRLVGGSGRDIADVIPSFNRDYILTYLTTSYGILAGAAVCCILAALIFLVFRAAVRQKNQLGLVMGWGCGLVFLFNTAVNILENVGWLPATQTFLPFFSAGGSCIELSYALVGLALSIYRYKDVYPEHVKTGFPKEKMTVD